VCDLGDKSFAGCYLFWAGVDGADVLDHILDDGIFGTSGVPVVNHNPGHIGVGRVELVSGHRDVVHKFVALGSSGAGVDGVPVQPVPGGADLALGHEIGGVLLEAEGEGQSLGVELVFAGGAGLDEVALALPNSVLAGERPAAAILGAAGVAVGV